jgi:prepilin-type N-terminal cleavage/methylation domain-containing protein
MMRAIFTRLASERGFTLSEMLVVISILGLILGAFSLIFSSSIRHSGEIQEQSLMQTEVRFATDRIAREVRQAYYGDGTTCPVTVTTGTCPITMSTATQLQFYSLDEQAPYHLRFIAYRLSGGALQRAMATSTNTAGPPWTMPALGAWGTVVGSIKNATLFTYFDSASPTPNATTTASSVRSVTITLTEATSTSPGRQYTYTTSAALRSA